MKKQLLFILLIILLASPIIVFAQSQCIPGSTSGTLCNALPNLGNVEINNIQDLIGAILTWFATVIGTLALVMVIYSGARMVTSQGDPAAIKQAKATMVYAISGLIIVMMSYVIVSALQYFIGVREGVDATNPENVDRSFFINPLRETKLLEFIKTSIIDFLGIIGAITILYIIISGFRYITSAGNEEQAKKGKAGLTWAIFGLISVILSYVIVQVVVNTVQ